MSFTIILTILIAISAFISMALKVVPQQEVYIVERFGKYHATFTAGLNFIIPVFDKVAYKHTL